VAHGQILSLYNIEQKKWILHRKFESQVHFIFRQLDFHGDFYVGVVLESGAIHTLSSKDTTFYREWEFDKDVFQLEGRIEKTVIDKEQDAYVLFLVQVGRKQFLSFIMFKKELQIVDFEDVDIDTLIDSPNLMPILGWSNQLICAN